MFHLGAHFLERYRNLINSFYKIDNRLIKRQLLMTTPLNILGDIVSIGTQTYAIVITITSGSVGQLVGYIQAITVVQFYLAAEKSGATPIIQSLPQGTETSLGRMFEQGYELSIGQWQKVALARAFMRQAPIVILDEPTSSIDAEAEVELFSRLQQVAEGATTLLIAHRFSTVRMSDRIIVLDNGQIIEDGTHETLMEIKGTYAHLFNIQATGYIH